MKLIDIEPVLRDLRILSDLLPEDQREVMQKVINILEEQPDIPVKGTE